MGISLITDSIYKLIFIRYYNFFFDEWNINIFNIHIFSKFFQTIIITDNQESNYEQIEEIIYLEFVLFGLYIYGENYYYLSIIHKMILLVIFILKKFYFRSGF